MATDKLTVTVDGVTDIPRLPGQSVRVWDGTPPDTTRMDIYSVYHDVSGNDLKAVAELSGSNWQMKYFRIAGEDHHTTIRDLDNGADRRIEYLVLGLNSDVDLISTRVDHVLGWDGDKHDVQLGSGYTHSVSLDADVNIVRTGSGDVGSIRTSGKTTIEIGDVYVGSVRTGSGNDKVTTGSTWVEYVGTGSDNDQVTMGSGGGLVSLGSGNDKIRVREMAQDGGVSVNGSSGIDTLDFGRFKSGVVFDLGEHGWQDLVPASKGAKGYVQQLGMENLTGGKKGDRLTGDDGNNKIAGIAGNDKLYGGGGNDKLIGGGGNDALFGQNGRDTLIGGTGRDTLIGGAGRDVLDGGKGNDMLRGNAGPDVFVFGKKSGTDTVKDYRDGTDILRLDGHTGGFADLTITKKAGDKVIVHDGGTIVLDGKAGVNLTASDFDFV